MTPAARLATWLVVSVLASVAWAGTTGRITGRVVDGKKQPLAGVTVGLVGAPLGAMSDENGQFTIVNIPAGAYTVRANLVGYRAVTTTNIIVSADESTRLELVLEEAPVQMQEVVVRAKRPVVEIHRTSTVAIVPREDIEKLPVQELQDVVNLQAGVVDGHFRGGRKNEVQYQVDGVSVNNAYDNEKSVRLDRSLLEEVQVVSGTFDAEYGQAMSGVVNAVLRRGGERLSWDAEAIAGGFLYSTGSRGQEFAFRPLGQQDYALTLSGPTGLAKTTFLANASRHTSDGAYYGTRRFTPALTPGDGEDVALRQSREWSGIAKLSTRLWEGREFSYQALVNAVEGRDIPWTWRLNPDGAKRQRSLSVVHGLGFTHTLTPKRFYSIDLRQNYYDYRDMVFDSADDPGYDAYGPPFTVEGYEHNAVIAGVDLGRFQLTTNAFLAKGTYVDQRSNTHQVKLGLEYQAPLMKFGAPGGALSSGQRPGGGFGVNRVYGPRTQFLPVFFSGFVQDQREWNDVTFRLGVRGDWFDARTTLPSDLANPANSIPDVPQSLPRDTENKLTISPRAGVSYPVSPTAALYFAYGHFYQYPPMRDIFSNSDYTVLADLQSATDFQRHGILGNPDIRAQKTVQYQIGVKQAVTPDLGLDFNAFYKDVRDLLGIEFINTYNEAQYVRFTNVDYGSVVGFTLQLDHRALGPVAVAADYTWQQGIGNSSEPDETLNRAKAGQDPLPRQVPFNWDQRHTLNVSVSTESAFGWSGSAIFRFASGQPYTPTIEFETPQVTNSARKPLGLVCDARAERRVGLWGTPGSFFVRAFNVFDSRFFNGFVFPSSGRADYSRFSVDAGQMANPTRFHTPRRVEVGLALRAGAAR